MPDQPRSIHAPQWQEYEIPSRYLQSYRTFLYQTRANTSGVHVSYWHIKQIFEQCHEPSTLPESGYSGGINLNSNVAHKQLQRHNRGG